MEMTNASCSVVSIYSGLGAVTAGGLWRGRVRVGGGGGGQMVSGNRPFSAMMSWGKK